MSSDYILTARDILQAQSPDMYRKLNGDIRELFFDMERKGLGKSGVWRTGFLEIFKTHLASQAKFIFETLKECVLIASPSLIQELKAEFSTQLETHRRTFAGLMQQRLSTIPNGTLDIGVIKSDCDRLIISYHAQLEIFFNRLMHEQNKQPQGGVHIYGNNPNVQVGDNNSQHIQLSIQRIEAAIDASQATTEQKTEAKSMLQKIMTNPLLASAIGGVVSGLTKTAVSAP